MPTFLRYKREGLFFFFFSKKSEGFILIERQNYFCFAVNVTRSWKGYLSAPHVIHAPVAWRRKRKAGSSEILCLCWCLLTQWHSDQTHLPKISFSWLLLLQTSESTTSLLFSQQLTIWEAADVSVAACSLGKRITTSLKAALAVAVPRSSQQLWIWPISVQISCTSSGMGQFGWERLAESQRSAYHL